MTLFSVDITFVGTDYTDSPGKEKSPSGLFSNVVAFELGYRFAIKVAKSQRSIEQVLEELS